MIIIRIIVFLLGALLVIRSLDSAIRTFVLPRGNRDQVAAFVFSNLRRVLNIFLKRMETYEQREHLMSFYTPIGLMLFLPTWYAMVIVGYTAMFWAAGIDDFYQAFLTSGSSLLTLGFATVEGFPLLILVYTEATIGLLLVALLIAYIPTIYDAFSRRESQVTRLEVRAGSPPSPVEFITRYYRIERMEQFGEVWETWEEWFADVTESHTSLAAVVFLRSPTPDKSWVTAAGVIMDTAALVRSTLDIKSDARADICIRAGYVCLRNIADFFGLQYNSDPHFPEDPISISREEYDEVYDVLQAEGIPLKEREQAWKDYAGWRVNYDTLLIAISRLVMAPYAMWSSDRGELGEVVDMPMRWFNPFSRSR